MSSGLCYEKRSKNCPGFGMDGTNAHCMTIERLVSSIIFAWHRVCMTSGDIDSVNFFWLVSTGGELCMYGGWMFNSIILFSFLYNGVTMRSNWGGSNPFPLHLLSIIILVIINSNNKTWEKRISSIFSMVVTITTRPSTVILQSTLVEAQTTNAAHHEKQCQLVKRRLKHSGHFLKDIKKSNNTLL